MRTYPQKSVYVNNYYYFYIYIFRVNHSSRGSKKTPKTRRKRLNPFVVKKSKWQTEGDKTCKTKNCCVDT